jgi:hypothetical protein
LESFACKSQPTTIEPADDSLDKKFVRPYSLLRVSYQPTLTSSELVHSPVEKSDLPEDVRERLFKRLNLDDYLKPQSG